MTQPALTTPEGRHFRPASPWKGLASRMGSAVATGVAGIRAWLGSCADAYAAASLYENLSRLSDVELRRRGLGRDVLTRDVSQLFGPDR